MRRPFFRLLIPAVILSALLIGASVWYLSRPDGVVELHEPVVAISTTDAWEKATRNDNCVLFVDCEWNVSVVLCRRSFQEFSKWCHSNDVVPLTMMIDSNDTTNDVWKICRQLWQDNDIYPGSMKNYGGAGRIVWIQNGEVVDYDWCMATTNPENLRDYETLKSRTLKAFR